MFNMGYDLGNLDITEKLDRIAEQLERIALSLEAFEKAALFKEGDIE